MMTSWIYFAIAAMLLFSFANIALKMASDKHPLIQTGKQLLLPIGLGLAVFLFASLYLYSTGVISIPGNLALMAGGALVAALGGFVLFLFALQQGKVAEVNAVLALGAIVTAIISNIFLKVPFTASEVIAMVLAVVSVSLFVL